MKIIQLTNSTPKQMMGYAVVASTGEVLVVDGGYYGDEDELKRVIKAVGGHVSLWLITHPHRDHHGAVIRLLSAPDGISFDALGAGQLPDAWATGRTPRDAEELLEWNAFYPTLGDRYFEIQAGQKFSLGSMQVEILTGNNPDIVENPFNEQSCVIRVTENGFTMLFLGDLAIEAGRRLLKKYPALHCDAVQMAHHGQQGVEETVYQTLCPRIAFWPTPDWLWDNTPYLGGTPGTGPFKTPEVALWMKKLNTRNIFAFTHTVVFDTADESVGEF